MGAHNCNGYKTKKLSNETIIGKRNALQASYLISLAFNFFMC
jgi:hypothetical protein